MRGRDKDIDYFCRQIEKRLNDNHLVAPVTEISRSVRENIRAVGEMLLGRMDVVSRTEFEEQTVILAATTARLEKMEQLLSEMEERAISTANQQEKPSTNSDGEP